MKITQIYLAESLIIKAVADALIATKAVIWVGKMMTLIVFRFEKSKDFS